MTVDVNATNIGLTLNQTLSLAQAISKKPCRYLYCKEMMRSLIDEALAAIPLWMTTTATLTLAIVLVSTVLSIVRKIKGLNK